MMLLCLLASNILIAQNASAQLERDLKITFLKDSLEAEENAFLFNNISLLYTGQGAVSLEINFSASSSVTVLSSAQAGYIELQPNQQQIIPIRFHLNKGISSFEWAAFAVSILIKETGQTIEKKFWVRQKAFTKWKCFLHQPEVFVKDGEQKVDFWVLVENHGNTPDEYHLDFNSELEIEMPKQERSFVLQAGENKMLKATVLLNIQQSRRFKNAGITVYINNKAGEKRALYQKLNSVGHVYNQEIYSWKKMPLTIEFGTQTSLDHRYYYTAALNGTLNLDGGKRLSVQMRTNDLNHQFKTNNSIATASYATKDWQITGGTIVDFNHFLINGNGLKLRRITSNEGYIEFAGINSSLYKTNQFNFKLRQPLSKKINLSNNSFINLDAEGNTKSYLTTNQLNWKIDKNNSLQIEGGVGTEKIVKVKIDTALYGSMYGYRFESNLKKLSLLSSMSYYSKNFPGFNKGFEYHNHELKFKQNKFYVAGFYLADKKIFTSPQDSVLRLLFNTNNKEYGIRSGYQFHRNSFALSAGTWQQQQDSVHSLISRMTKVSTSISAVVGKGLSFSLLTNAGYVYLVGRPDISPFFALNNWGTVQIQSFGTHFRYDRGPYYYYEIKQYAQEQRSFSRVQIAPFIDQYLKKLNTSFRLELNYTHEQPSDYHYMLVTSQLLFSPLKLNLDLGLLGRVDLMNHASPLVNFTIRKRLQAPVSRNRDSYNFKVFLYKDLNDNNVFDAADEVVPQANVVVNNNWLITDANGTIEFKNVSKEEVVLDLSKISHLKGWIPSNGFIQTILPGKNIKKIWVPFKKSKVITGRLVLIADENSTTTMQLSNIRITASDSTGKQYSTLTDMKGDFNLSLPAGDYIVTVNEQVFDQNFKPLEFSKTADLINNDSIELTFEIIQKKRQVNIRRSE